MEGTSLLLLFLISLGFVAGYRHATRGLALGADLQRSQKREAGQDRPRWIAPPEDTDPVCGKIISTEHAKPSLCDGWVYYFCSQECRDIFEAAPANYTAARREGA
jgi:YHS domain-containing protein